MTFQYLQYCNLFQNYLCGENDVKYTKGLIADKRLLVKEPKYYRKMSLVILCSWHEEGRIHRDQVGILKNKTKVSQRVRQ